jgi:peptide/nickel transport system substrate-binding protein
MGCRGPPGGTIAAGDPAMKISFPRSERPAAAGLLTLALCLLLGLGFACGPGDDEAGDATRGGEAADGAPHRGGTLVVGSIADLEGVNELTASSSRVFSNIGFQMFSHLLEEQPDFEEHPPTFEPSLAASYDWSDDHLHLTFHLRDDIFWSDGEPITADDVRFTFEAQKSPEVAWNDAFVKNAIESVEVIDPRTVVFHFSQVSPSQLLDAIEGVILPEHAWGKLPFSEWRTNADFFTENMVVSGPFQLDTWTPQQEIVLVRNERYRHPDDPDYPYLDRIVVRMIPERSNQVAQLLAGSLHVVEQLPTTDVERVRHADGVRLDPYYHRLFSHVVWNLKKPLFADRAVRQALTLAIDRQQIVDTLWGEYGRIADSPIVKNCWAHDDSLEPWPYDPARARRMLAEAGWSDHDGDGVIDKDGVPFRFEITTNQGNDERLDALVMIKEHLRRVGIDAEPRTMEFNALFDRLYDHEFDAVLSAWGMPTTLSLRYAFHTDSIAEGENFSAYSNPELDALIDRMEGMAEIEETEPLLHEMQRIIHRDQPMTMLWESQRIVGSSERLHDLDPNLLGTLWFLHRAWLEPPPA